MTGALLLLAGCLAPQADDTSLSLRFRNWWNYYERGLACLRSGQPAAARADFERCLGERGGARFSDDQDRWRARTYGMHVVEGYFPNRELGIACYEAHDYTNATRWLERSLQQTPSGRAKHYLNLIHQREAQARRPAPPQVVWDGPSRVITRERYVLVRGAVHAAGYASGLTVAGHPHPVELAQTQLPFATRVPLREGTNEIRVEAADLAGNRITATRTYLADWQPPMLTIQRVSRETDGQWRVTGSCRDDHGLASLRVGVVDLPRPTGTNDTVWPFDVRIHALDALLVAEDRAGNRLETQLTLETLSATEAPLKHASEVALADTPVTTDTPAAPHLAPATTDVTVDRLAPSLQLRGLRDISVVLEEEFYLDGTAADGGGLRTVTINGEELLAEADRGALRSCFARRLPLLPGTNNLTVTATDRAGNRTVRQTTVVRRAPEQQDRALRLSVGLPPLLPADAGPIGVRAKRGMECELVREPIRFRLLERDEGWDYILREQGLSISDLADPRAALRIGKLMPAEMLLMGRLITEARGLTIYVKAVDTASGEVLFAADVYSTDPDRTLDEDAANLILKIKQGFSLVSAAVIRRQGATATLGIGTRDGAGVGHRFVVARGTAEGDNPSGSLRRADGRPVQLVMERVEKDSAVARIIPADASDSIQEGDHVYAR